MSYYLCVYQAIVQYLIDGGLQADQIILMTPPALGEEAWTAACMEKYGPKHLLLSGILS